MTIISSLVRFGKRQLHTIVSKQIIKPSSPTPSHLKTYNLSSIDQFAPDAYMPMLIFYPNPNTYTNPQVKMINDLKNSLSRTLTQYYPFAGRLAKTTPSFVDCNDEGVVFLEAHNDNRLSDFINNMHHEDLDQFFPNGLLWKKLRSYSLENDRTSPLAVQVNQFACGGIAVAVSLSHKIADGSSLCNFFNDWAITTRSGTSMDQNYASPIDPYFMSFNNTNLNYQGVSLDKSRDSAVTKSFVFPGSKINELKQKVVAMTAESEQPVVNPTRMEVINWLLYKCALKAARKNNNHILKTSGFVLVTNIRNKMSEPLPKTTIGNFYSLPTFSTKNPDEITPSAFIAQLKSLKMEVKGIQNINNAVEMLPQSVIEKEQRKFDECYMSTSLCRYPLYEIDFGWGKPIKAAIAGTFKHNGFLAVDDRHGDGVKVFVNLGKQDMEIFKSDSELRSFC
ncbi:hypothetical protein QVD17_00529 [Tagetes erecta]|uniref:Transferase, Chloramphenicol acetyltransferase-like domain protein n=1 Tax=Tagetes erecta TaxID=13708 RepID=A0AAD8P5Y0_TARER|nr:hypothetical protein QVD17_00529 [Tagetes erecta]